MAKKTVEDRIIELLNRPGVQPQRRTDLAKALGLSPAQRTGLRKTLLVLEQSGKVVCLRKNRWAAAQAAKHQLTGTVRMNDRGAGFFVSDDGKKEVYIARDNLKCALHEDRVAIELLTSARRTGRAGSGSEPSAEGRVLDVLERKNSEVVGLLRRSRYYAYMIPDNLRLTQDIRVREWAEGLEETPEDYKVVVRLDEWTDPFKPLTGSVIESIGHRDDPHVEMQCILRAHGFRQNFPDEVLAEVETIAPTLSKSEIKERVDLRKKRAFTIDPESARDFDDAISLDETAEGWMLSVHIADVSHFVKPGSRIDQEALHRGNSVYLVDRVVMMLPTELTTRICSLNPDVDRAAFTVEIDLDRDANPVAARSFRSVIRSCARLTYEQVQTLFDGKESHGIPEPVAGTLRQLRPLARRIRERRFEQGSLEINTPQIQCVLGKDGKVASIRKGEAKEAYQLIEECMLLANVSVARQLREAGRAALHRIHEEPDEEQWAQMGAELQALGIPALPQTRGEINAVIEQVAGTPLEYTASLAVLRNLKRAGYSAEALGHFGLAFDDYVHFTSPIRRYPDLVIHRLLDALNRQAPPPVGSRDLESIAAQCTRTETEADAAEKESIELRRVEYYNTLLYRGETGPYTGCITRFLNKGLVVELTDTLQRGLVPFGALTDDHYDLNSTKTRATGRRHRKTYTIGDSIEVELVKVDVARRFVDFRPAGDEPDRSASPRAGKGQSPRTRGGRKKKKQVTMTGERVRGARVKQRRHLK